MVSRSKTLAITVSLVSFSAMVGLLATTLTNLSEEPEARVSTVLGISNCGGKYSTFRFIAADNSTRQKNILHEHTIMDETGAFFKAPRMLNEACKPTIKDYQIPLASIDKVETEEGFLRVKATTTTGRVIWGDAHLNPQTIPKTGPVELSKLSSSPLDALQKKRAAQLMEESSTSNTVTQKTKLSK